MDTHIEQHDIINLDCIIGHDVVLADFVTLYPSVNVSGKVKISECTEIGTGSIIIQVKRIGDKTVIGAGTAVINDIGSNCTAVRSPAKVVKCRAGESGENNNRQFTASKGYYKKIIYAVQLRGAA